MKDPNRGADASTGGGAPAAREHVFPAAFAQRRLWFLDQLEPNTSLYNVPVVLRLTGPLDIAALERAFEALLTRHEILRTRFRVEEWEPVQVVSPTPHPESLLQKTDLSAEPRREAEGHARELAQTEIDAPFDLARGPLVRAYITRVAADDHVLVLALHHILVDAWSLSVLTRELGTLYGLALSNERPELPPLALQYADYAIWQREWLQGERFARLLDFWRGQLRAPIPALALPSDRPRPPVQTFHGAVHTLRLPASAGVALDDFCRAEKVTLFTCALALFSVLLHQLSGQRDILVGTPVAGRSRPGVDQIVGLFINTVVLRTAVDPGDSFRTHLARVRDVVLDGLANQDVPFEKLVEELEPERDSGRSPFFQALLVAQPADRTEVTFPGLTVSPLDGLTSKTAKFDLSLFLTETKDGLEVAIEYNSDLFEAETVTRMATHFRTLLEEVVADPSHPLAELPEPETAEAPKRESTAMLLERLVAADIRLSLDGERLRLNAPRGAVTEVLRATIAARKEELIAALQNSAAGTNGSSSASAIPRIPRERPLPVSSVQQRFWFLNRMGGGDASYNVGASIRIRGRLDAGILRRAIDELIRRHESLRSRIGERDGVPELEIVDSAGASLEAIDISHLSAMEREKESLRLLGERFRASFDLAAGPLSAYLLIRLAPDEHAFAVSIHHIVADGWSMQIAVREIFAMYEALAAGCDPSIAPLRVQYVDYAAWEQEQLQSGQMRRQLNYWKQELAGAPSLLELPTDRPRPTTPSLRGHRIVQEFDVALLEPLKALSREHEVTLFMTLVAALQLLLHRYSGQDDIVIGSPVANRVEPELEGIIGCFVNNLVLRGRVGGNPTFAEFLDTTKQAILGAFDHRNVPFDLIVDGLAAARGANHAPIFQVMLTLFSFPTAVPAPPGLSFDIIQAPEAGSARTDLTVEIGEYDGRFFAAYEFASDLFDSETIVRMHVHFAALLRAAITDPTVRVEELPMLDTAEGRLLLDEWNDTSIEYDREECVHQLFEAAARGTPGATAASAGQSALTYRDLDERANRLAQLLVRRGVEPGALVAVCLDRTIDVPVALLAIWKAGAAYVPLDPTHPLDRLRYTLEDAGVLCAITVSRFAALFAAANTPIVPLDDVEAELAALSADGPTVTVRATDRAYVIYTSGSTGRPKGVEVEHRNVVAFLRAMRQQPGSGPQDTFLAVTTLSFDIAGLEFWLPLTTGGRVVIASRSDVLDGERLIGLMNQHEITVMQATPATWRLMLDAGWTGKRDLRALCGGEALPRDLARSLVDRVGELWNMYGPTETTIWSTLSRIENADAPITIGRPIANTRVYILERSGHPAPIGVPGELCIGGEGVARGYHNRPELTAQKFASITLPNARVERVYRTGDMARFLADGRIEFLGRRDQQVKVRGYRIELGEIEAVLSTHPGVKACAVAVREDSPGDQRIAGYIVRTESVTFDPEAARTTLRGRLPEYMIPNLFMILPALPLTPNGKVDHKALPAPQALAKPVADVAEAMMTPPQRRVAAAWREVLRADRVGLHDNFFDVGGHSLLLVKLHVLLKREFGVAFELVELFQWTTVAGQATRLSAAAAPNGALRRAQSRAARQTK